MRILITPKQLVELCVWDDYIYFCLDTKKVNVKELLDENVEFEIDQKDALVIGLTKVIETNNFIHKFNEYLMHLISIKSSKQETTFMCKKHLITPAIIKFKNKFPAEYTPGDYYKQDLADVLKYVDDVYEKVDALPTKSIKDKMGTYDYIQSNAIKKQLCFHN